MRKLFIISWVIWIIGVVAIINFAPHNQEIKSINEFEYIETTDRKRINPFNPRDGNS